MSCDCRIFDLEISLGDGARWVGLSIFGLMIDRPTRIKAGGFQTRPDFVSRSIDHALLEWAWSGAMALNSRLCENWLVVMPQVSEWRESYFRRTRS